MPSSPSSPSSPHTEVPADKRPRAARGRWIWIALVLIFGAPVVAAYVAYYVVKPQGAAINYGTLIDPQRPIPAGLVVRDEAGRSLPLDTLRGTWLFVMTGPSACDTACAQKLYFMRQVRALQNNERARITMVWLRSDAAPVPARIEAAYPDTRKLIADPAAVAAWLPAQPPARPADHLYLVDPNGNLMMRFPQSPDPGKMRRDVSWLLRWSGLG